MPEHAIDDAKCMSLCPICKGKTNVQVYMHAMYKNPLSGTHKVAKSSSNREIQKNKLKI